MQEEFADLMQSLEKSRLLIKNHRVNKSLDPVDLCCLCSGQAPVIVLRSSSGSHPFLCCVHPRSSARLWCGAGGAGAGGWGTVATAMTVLPPKIRAASVADLSQDASAPDPAPSCRVG